VPACYNAPTSQEIAMSAAEVPQIQIQIQIDDQVAQGIYANMAMVNHNETEFVLDFIYVQPQAKAQVRSRIITSPKHLKRFLLALQDNVARYEAQFGKLDVGTAGPDFRFQH
jgi:hypothetical protein